MLGAHAARVAVLAAVACASHGCGGDAGEPPNGTDAQPSRDPGAAVIEVSGCLSCHRIGDRGNAQVGGALTGGELSAGRVRRALADPPAGMPPYPDMSAADRADLVRYLESVR